MPIKLRSLLSACALFLATPGFGQAPDALQPTTQGTLEISALPPAVSTQPLGDPAPGAAGLLPAQDVGLPRALWRGSDPTRLAELIAQADTELPALRSLIRSMVLAEVPPPNHPNAQRLLEARLDWLIDRGAVDEALALLDLASPEAPGLFARWADLALLLNQSDALCDTLRHHPERSQAIDLRVFCVARQGDWLRAALILDTARALNALPARRIDLLERFLDPEATEGRPDLLPPVRPTALEFRLFEAIGEPLPTTALPLAFATLDLSGRNGWRAQLEAAERLARVGALPAPRLRGLYLQQRPAASGGVWDRAAAVQALDAALTDGTSAEISDALNVLWPQAVATRLLDPVSELYGVSLVGRKLPSTAGQRAIFAAFLTKDAMGVASRLPAAEADQALWAIAHSTPYDAPTELPFAQAISKGLGNTLPSAEMLALRDADRLGEALLRTIAQFDTGAAGNPDDLSTAIATLRALGHEATAIRAALQLMILSHERAL